MRKNTITLHFDRPLSENGYSVDLGNRGKDAFPKINGITYGENNQSVVMQVQLLPNQIYQMVLTGRNFKSPDGVPLKTYEVNFRTK